MRSRSMVKQGQPRGFPRAAAKSLDRKDTEMPNPSRFSKGKYLDNAKSRKVFNEEVASKKMSKTPAAPEGDVVIGSTEYDKYLPMDFQQLLQSPPEKTKPCCQRQNNNFSNFIQCGTNIISSIWSAADAATERMEEEMLPLDWDDDKPTTAVWSSASGSLLGPCEMNFFNNNNNGNEENAYDWSDVESTSLAPLEGDGCFFSRLEDKSNALVRGATSGCSLLGQCDLNVLNNNKKNSSEENSYDWSDVESTSLAPLEGDDCFFTRLAGGNTASFAPAKKQSNLAVSPKNKQPILYTYKQTISDQEEDLLTSTKTHFRPIKQEVMDTSESIGTAISRSGGGYADGTSFPVSSSLDKVSFERSESGALYLGPNEKYMEYKVNPQDSPSSSPEPFIPKFKVNPNEKFCQTDDKDCKESGAEGSSCEFFFPEDERLAEDMVNSLVDENCNPECSGSIKVEGFLTAWPITNVGTSHNIWSNNSDPSTYPVVTSNKTWLVNSSGWSVNCIGDGEKKDSNCDSKIVGGDAWNGEREHYVRLRNELSEDGEQLLSDLSSIHLFIDSDNNVANASSISFDSHTKGHFTKCVRIRPCIFQSGAPHNQNDSLPA